MSVFKFHLSKIVVGLFVLFSVQGWSQQPLFTALSPTTTHISFANNLTETANNNVILYQYLYNGGGVAAGDVNNDGLCDLFFTGNMVPDQLYLNKGNLTFENISEKASILEPTGWSTGVTMADVNADGWLDIYVCRSGQFSTADRHNLLYINNQNNTFTESAKTYGLNDSSFSTQSAFFDMDLDGDLDMFLLNHAVTQMQGYNTGDIRMRRDVYAGNKLYRNDSNYFTDISAQAGINGSPMTFGLGVSIGDINGDKLPDIFVSNDYQEQDFLYVNSGNGVFVERIEKSFGHTANFSMGCDLADINNDTYPDILSMDMLPEDNYRQKKLKGGARFDAYQMAADYGFFFQHMHNMLQLNNGDGTFSEIAWSAGIAATDWSWAPLIADFDNDGFQDIYITNGYRRDFTDLDFLKFVYGGEEQKAYAENRKLNTFELVNQMPSVKIPNYALKGNKQIRFTDVSSEWGIDIPSFSNGAAYADLDNDGDLEIIVNNINDTAFIFRNNAVEQGSGHYMRLQIRGDGKNPFAIGTRITVNTDSTVLTREIFPTRGFQSSVDPIVHIGVGKATHVAVDIQYPNGHTDSYRHIPVDTTLILQYAEMIPMEEIAYPTTSYVTKIAETFLPYTHTDVRFEDFKREPLLMQKESDNGPRMATGDINADGVEDIFFTGAKNKKARLFLSSNEGYFPALGGPWERDSAYEDVDAIFFDADGDADLDLYVVSGSNEYPMLSRYYQDRLYINTGNGKFVSAPNAVPENLHSKSCVVTGDFDADGDLDLFVGGNTVAGKYPETAGSFIFENNNGFFKDVTASLAPSLTTLGNISKAMYLDIDDDEQPELILAGKWMPITIISFTKGKTNMRTIPNSSGWWNCIYAADIDNDGDKDLIAGNRGSNHPVKVDLEHPATLYNYDFDGNGTIDPIVTAAASDGQTYPINTLDDLLEQIPSLKKKYIYYEDYANATLPQMFSALTISDLPQYAVANMHSCIFRNQGNGEFSIEALPQPLQWYPIYAMALRDIDRDGDVDLMAAGNNFSVRPEFTRMDAGMGNVLLNDGSGHFTNAQSLQLRKEVRDLKVIRMGSTYYMVAAVRNGDAQTYLLSK